MSYLWQGNGGEMREIKFRAWDNKQKLMLTWDWFDNETIDQVFKMDRFILMQYTGLKDENGVDIYEGDIFYCNYDKKNFEIVFNEKGYFEKKGSYGVYVADNLVSQFGKVIGNIYENPELLVE